VGQVGAKGRGPERIGGKLFQFVIFRQPEFCNPALP
jgi:hypothetical protein